MLKKIITILLLVINYYSFGMQPKQPKSLTCQALRTVVENALKTGNMKEFNVLPGENLPIAAEYLYQTKNNPTVALFNNYINLHNNRQLPDVTSFLVACGADNDLIQSVLVVLDENLWNEQAAFNKLLRDNNLKGIELFVLSNLRELFDLNKTGLYSATIMPALFKAIEAGDINLVRLLIENGADVNYKGSYHFKPLTPLLKAIYTTTQLLTSKYYERTYNWEPHTNKNESSILDQYEEIIILLLKSGADINARTSDGDSPLNAARSQEQLTGVFGEQLIDFLKAYGAQ